MIERLVEVADTDRYGNTYGTCLPSQRELMNKINELVDAIEFLNSKVDYLTETLEKV